MSRLFRCTICDAVTDPLIQSHGEVKKPHFYEDPKHSKTGHLCSDCYAEYLAVSLEFKADDSEREGRAFNYSFKKVR
jgi:secreted Zn-dependent insulinase-like peptidase